MCIFCQLFSCLPWHLFNLYYKEPNNDFCCEKTSFIKQYIKQFVSLTNWPSYVNFNKLTVHVVLFWLVYFQKQKLTAVWQLLWKSKFIHLILVRQTRYFKMLFRILMNDSDMTSVYVLKQLVGELHLVTFTALVIASISIFHKTPWYENKNQTVTDCFLLYIAHCQLIWVHFHKK